MNLLKLISFRGWVWIGVIAFCACVWAIILWQGHELDKVRKANAELTGYVNGYKNAQATELKITVFQKDMKVTVKQATDAIQRSDPKCADPMAVIVPWRDGLGLVRKAGKDDHSPNP